MSMVGDAETQPTEGVTTLSDLTALMDGGEEEAGALEESAEGEEAEESEEVEASGEEGEQESEEEAEEPTVTVKVDGKEVVLKQSEAIELAQKGLDYTKKTMALGEERRAFESEREAVTAIRSEVAQHREQAIADLETVHAFMSEQIGNPPDIRLAAEDVGQFILAKELYEGQRAKLGQVAQALHQMRQQQGAEQASQRQQRQAKVERELIDSLPGWKEAPAERFKEAADYVRALGLTPDEVGDAALTVGFWQLAHKAKAYDALLAKKAEMKPVAQLPKVSKPGTNNQPPQLAKRQEAMKRHRANPSISSLADLL